MCYGIKFNPLRSIKISPMETSGPVTFEKIIMLISLKYFTVIFFFLAYFSYCIFFWMYQFHPDFKSYFPIARRQGDILVAKWWCFAKKYNLVIGSQVSFMCWN